MIQIKPITKCEYGNKEFAYRFTTTGYYDIDRTETGLKLIRKPLLEPEEICDPAFILESWLPDPDAYGAFEDDRLIGFVEGYLEKWNGRYWITNLHILDTQKRGAGIGTALMARIQTAACQSGARMIALETQNNNENAIAFYLKNGFTPIGLDLYFYSNADPEKHNVRLLLGKLLR